MKSEILEFKPRKEDVEAGRVYPNEIIKYFGFLTEWLADAINLVLNRKVMEFGYQNIGAILQGKTLKDSVYFLEIDLYERLSF